ncbi:MAG: hypothetical protein M3451_07895 [Chloroflexota bacterium]|nr:hypothetical protein [Chloroflexota bacterium]
MSDVIDPEMAVREYLLFLENPEQLVDHESIESLKTAVNSATDPIEKLKALARLEKAQQPAEGSYREAFIGSVKAWAETNSVPTSAFLSMGVERSVLRDAGLLGSSRPASSRSARRPSTRSTTVDDIKRGVMARQDAFTLATIAADVGGSPMTVRKAINEMIETGHVEREGPKPDWSGPGRAPILFRRR